MPYASVNNIDLHYEIDGEGPAVILLTGFGGDIGFWRRATDLLSKDFTVLRIDNRGTGKTKYSDAFTLNDISMDVIALLDHLKIMKANILGWSMGSHIAEIVTESIPERIISLTLVSTYGHRPSRSKYVLTAMTDAAENGMPTEYFAKVMNCMCYTEEFFAEREIDGREIRLPSLENVEGLRHQLEAVEVSDISESVKSISVPTLVVHGDKDVMVDPDEGATIAKKIPECELLVVKGAGHLISADRYIPEVREFMKRHCF